MQWGLRVNVPFINYKKAKTESPTFIILGTEMAAPKRTVSLIMRYTVFLNYKLDKGLQ